MANTTDADFAAVDGHDFGMGARAPGHEFQRQSGPPFGDPDQFLFGGGGHRLPSPDEPVRPTNSPYEGRHRAAD